jgi:hypothetical protein
MKPQKNPLRPEMFVSQAPVKDQLMAENQLIKLKLELEYGMSDLTSGSLQPAVENQWLRHLYNFEQEYKEAKSIKVYDYLGRPDFRKVEKLNPREIEMELDRILSLMEEKKLALDYSGDYEKPVLYKFVTEELFEHEIEDVSLDGMVSHFIYEEFHPNHEQDLRKYTEEFIDIVFRKKWDRFDSHCFAAQVQFKGTEYDNEGIASIVQTFQEAHDSFSLDQFQIEEVTFDVEKEHAEVLALIRYDAKGYVRRAFGGTCKISFRFQWGYWYINGFRLPGFGD